MAESRSPAYRVLIVDDEESVRTVVARMLQRPPYETATAADGTQAIAIAEARGPFDLLVTDFAMPGMSGDELARRLRCTDPFLKILYLTGYSDRLFEQRSVLWEDEAFLEKPVSVQALLEAVALLLQGRVPPSRAVRVTPRNVHVRFANVEAKLVMLSVTGALIYAATERLVGSRWPVVLECPEETVHLTGRVVTCEPTTGSSGTIESPCYAVALAFVQPSARGLQALERVCRPIGESGPDKSRTTTDD